MKAFIKHWNKEIRPYIHNPKDREVAEYWWRAALEWALKQQVTVDCLGTFGRDLLLPGTIEEELDEE